MLQNLKFRNALNFWLFVLSILLIKCLMVIMNWIGLIYGVVP